MNKIVNYLEKAILGCFLLNDNFHNYYEKLSLTSFSNELHANIFMVMINLFEDKVRIDPLTVLSRLSLIRDFNKEDYVSYIYELANEVPSHQHIDSYIYELEYHNYIKEKDNEKG
jgi:replicative DNA helicase